MECGGGEGGTAYSCGVTEQLRHGHSDLVLGYFGLSQLSKRPHSPVLGSVKAIAETIMISDMATAAPFCTSTHRMSCLV